MAFTTTELLRSIKVKGQIPTSQNTFSATDMLGLADDEIRQGLVPLIMGVRESYFQTYEDVTVEDGTDRYAIPERAIGEKLKEVQLIDAQGNVTDLRLVPVETLDQFGTTGMPIGFYFEGSDVVLVPSPVGASAYSLRMHYYRRPNSLVAVTAVGTITDIDTVTKEVTISSTPSTFTTARSYDLIKAKPGFKTLAQDQEISAVGSNILTFSESLPDGLAVGDFVALATESPVPQIPADFHPVLALRVATTILRSLGHDKEADSKQKELNKIEEAVLALISPRVDGEPKIIKSTQGVLNPGGNYHWLNRY